jgi:hypothetical protein
VSSGSTCKANKPELSRLEWLARSQRTFYFVNASLLFYNYGMADLNRSVVYPGESAPKWEIVLAWILKIMIWLTAIVAFGLGNILLGLWGFIAILISLLPAWLARTHRVNFPVEIELLLLLILISDFTFGQLFNFYDRLIYFDKILHYHNSMMMAFLGFLLIYALYFTGKLKISPFSGGVVILFVTLGIGGLWEILEYLSDRILATKAQGSPLMSPFDDTMWDLIVDFFGGIVGAVLGSIYIRYSKRTRSRRFIKIMETLGGDSAEEAEIGQII